MSNKTNGRKAFYIGFSVLIAAALWFYVDNGRRVQTEAAGLPIEYLNEDTTLAERGFMLLDDSDQTVDLTLEATRPNIARLDKSKIRIRADLSGVTATGRQSISYRIFYPDTRFFSSVTTKDVNFTVSVNVGELYSVDVPIRCEVQGSVAEGYIAGELQIEPSALEIRGVQEEVDRVAYAKAVLVVDDATATVSQTLDYRLYDASGRPLENVENLHATADQIQVTLPVNVVKELALKMNFLEAPGAAVANLDYTIEPATVTVSGDAGLLRYVDSLTLDDFDLAEFSAPTTYNYTIPIPSGCENLSGTTRATLNIRFKDLAEGSVQAANFLCENEPEGKTVTVLTTELPVRFRGTAADVGSILTEHVTVVGDLTELSGASGSYTVPATVRITGPTGTDVGVLGTYQLRVNIAGRPAGEPEPPQEETEPPREETEPPPAVPMGPPTGPAE